jgi:HAD superfamily hydrolase (TIGR01509 family)
MTSNHTGAVLWDLDGVIADTGVYHKISWMETLHKAGIAFTEEDFNHVFGMRNDETLREVLGKDFTQEKLITISRAKEAAFRRLIKDHINPLPGVIELLASLQRVHFSQAIVSSTPIENIDLITKSLNIKSRFDLIISSGDVTEGKPSPQGYLLAAGKLGKLPENCVVIEDAVAGVTAAKRGGMKCIAVTNSHPAESLSKADMVVHSLESVNVAVVTGLLNHGKI